MGDEVSDAMASIAFIEEDGEGGREAKSVSDEEAQELPCHREDQPQVDDGHPRRRVHRDYQNVDTGLSRLTNVSDVNRTHGDVKEEKHNRSDRKVGKTSQKDNQGNSGSIRRTGGGGSGSERSKRTYISPSYCKSKPTSRKPDQPPQSIAQYKTLSYFEKKYLVAVERGDLAGVQRLIENPPVDEDFNVNCCDPIGRSALLMAIDNENLEMIEVS